MESGQALHEGEADAHAALGAIDGAGRLEEEIEHARQHLGADADPGVLHSEHGLVALSLQTDRDATAGIRVLDRVAEQVRDDLLESQRIAGDDHRRGGEHVEIDPVKARRLAELQRDPLQQIVQIHRLLPDGDLAPGHARHVEQVVDEPRKVAHLPLDDAALAGEAVACLPVEKLARDEDGSERIAQLVAEHGEELIAIADRLFQLFEQVADLVLPLARAQGRPDRAQEGSHADGPVEKRQVAGQAEGGFVATSEDDDGQIGPRRLLLERRREARPSPQEQRLAGDHHCSRAGSHRRNQVVHPGADFRLETGALESALG